MNPVEDVAMGRALPGRSMPRRDRHPLLQDGAAQPSAKAGASSSVPAVSVPDEETQAKLVSGLNGAISFLRKEWAGSAKNKVKQESCIAMISLAQMAKNQIAAKNWKAAAHYYTGFISSMRNFLTAIVAEAPEWEREKLAAALGVGHGQAFPLPFWQP